MPRRKGYSVSETLQPSFVVQVGLSLKQYHEVLQQTNLVRLITKVLINKITSTCNATRTRNSTRTHNLLAHAISLLRAVQLTHFALACVV